MRDKNLTITVLITSFLFIFVFLLIYVIYCYAFYDKKLFDTYIDKFNNRDYEFVYMHMDDKDLSFKEFIIPINIMYDKSNLESIYNKHYAQYNISKDEFIDKYYYGNRYIDDSMVSFKYYGKTSLFKRINLKYEKIEVINKLGYSSTIGVIKNVNLLVNDNSLLELDGTMIDCIDNICKIDSIYGGIHEIKYKNNNIVYYALVNINKNDSKIDVNLLDNLVKDNFEINRA